MIKITKDVLKICADNLKFELSEDQLDLLLKEFDSLLKQMSFLDKIEGIDQLEPMAYPYEIFLDENSLREDEASCSEEVDSILKNTKNRLGNQVKIPKVLG